MLSNRIEQFSMVYFSFFNEPIAKIVDALSSIYVHDLARAKLPAEALYRPTQAMPESICFPNPPKGYRSDVNILLWEPLCKPNTTVFFCNTSDGGEIIASKLSLKNDFEVFQIAITNNYRDDNYITYFFHMKGDFDKLRIVRVMKDPKWVFYEQGEPLWFEKTELYKKRLVREKLTPQTVIDYLRALGWKVDETSFWEPIGDKIIFTPPSSPEPTTFAP